MDARLAAYVAALPARAGRSPEFADTAVPVIPFRKQLQQAGLIWRFGMLVIAHLGETGLVLASWSFIGYGALSGRVDGGWLAAWALCLGSTVFLRAAVRRLQGTLVVGFSGLLKQRLLAGATLLDPEVLRRKGAGEFLGETLEAEVIEGLGTGAGVEILLAALDLLIVPFLLAYGAAAASEIVLLGAWVILCLLMFAANLRLRSQWAALRLALTHRSVENMAAHRTRTAQQSPRDWHREEDSDLRDYSEISEKLDRLTTWIEAALPRGYAIAALALLVPAFLAAGATATQEAITLGTVLFAGAAMERLTFGMGRGATSWVAWRSVKPMFDAAAKPVLPGVARGVSPANGKVLRAQDIVFTHQGHTDAVLRGCNLTLERGDFLLLEGDSGSGKSTLAALLAGMRRPSAGVILTGAVDRETLGDVEWRRRIVVAPQYHENHILSAPLKFNLLLGRPYPHSAQDAREAQELCQELGLGPLLDRMPAGLDQMVGETGWQLSQGERSRVFLARALLQRPEVMVLDETLAALDPENLQQCLECVMRRAQTLLLIAHP